MMEDAFLQAVAGPGPAQPAAADALAVDALMPQRKPHEPLVRDFLRIKVLSMGDGHTGKSCLIKRYCEQRVRAAARRAAADAAAATAAAAAAPLHPTAALTSGALALSLSRSTLRRSASTSACALSAWTTWR